MQSTGAYKREVYHRENEKTFSASPTIKSDVFQFFFRGKFQKQSNPLAFNDLQQKLIAACKL